MEGGLVITFHGVHDPVSDFSFFKTICHGNQGFLHGGVHTVA